MVTNNPARTIKLLIFIGAAGYLLFYFYRAYFYVSTIHPFQLSLKTLELKNVSADSILNEKVILIFFQTWCRPCIQEMQLINKHAEEFNFVKIYFITDESPEKVKHLLERVQGKNIFVLLSDKALSEIGITAFPTAYFFKDKKCLEKHKGVWIDDSNFEDAMYHLRMIFH
ncbi:MAG: hypothetical protein Fur0023_13210 [Bacteroidia bacterium]